MTEATHDDGARRRTEALQAARQRDSHTKRAHVRSTIEKMLLAGDPVTFTTVARAARVSTWLVYADGVREHIQAAIRQQADQPANHAADDPASMVSLRTDLALAATRSHGCVPTTINFGSMPSGSSEDSSIKSTKVNCSRE
jgi:hypothetical protein